MRQLVKERLLKLVVSMLIIYVIHMLIMPQREFLWYMVLAYHVGAFGVEVSRERKKSAQKHIHEQG